MKIRRGGVAREIQGASIFYLGARRRLRTIKQKRGGSLVTLAIFAPPMTATVTPAFVSGSDHSSGSPTKAVATGNATLSVTGGIGPYTYQWEVLSSSGGSPQPSTPNLASTRFVATIPLGTTHVANFVGTVTDSLGTSASAIGTAEFTYT